MENKIWIIFSIAAGFFVGMNWDKIEKTVKPYAETAIQKAASGAEEAKKFLEKQKAKVRKGKKAELQSVSKAPSRKKAVASEEG